MTKTFCFVALTICVFASYSLCISAVEQQQTQGESEHEFNLLRDVKLFEIVTPKVLSQFKMQRTDGTTQRYADHLEYEFAGFGKNFHLTLEKNKELFSKNYVQIQYVEDQIIKENPHTDDVNCHYWGKESRTSTSDVVVSTCDGLRGLINSEGVAYFIEPASSHQHLVREQLMNNNNNKNSAYASNFNKLMSASNSEDAHVLYRVQDMNNREFECGTKGHGHNMQSLFEQFLPQALKQPNLQNNENSENSGSTQTTQPTQSSQNSFRSEASEASSEASSESESDFVEIPENQAATNVPNVLYVELLLVNDISRFLSLGNSTETRTAGFLSMMNFFYANSALSPSVRIVLVGQVTFKTADPYNKTFVGTEVAIDNLLSTFLNWHTNNPNLPPHDAAQLISSLDFQGRIIGYAPVGSMCQPYYSGGLIQATYGDLLNSMVASHEMGHNFGMSHDSLGNTCPPSGFLMASIGCVNCRPDTVFSSCSKTAYGSWVNSSRYKSCLYNVPAM